MRNQRAKVATPFVPRFARGGAAALALVGLVIFVSSRVIHSHRTKAPIAASVSAAAVRSKKITQRVAAARAPNVYRTIQSAGDSDPSKTEALALVDRICDTLEAGDASWQSVVSSGLLPALVRSDPSAAACVAEAWEPGELREGLLREVGREWSERNSIEALAWAQNLPNTGERNDVLGDICIQISQTDPAQAVAIADRLRIGEDDGVLAAAAQLWAAKDYNSALQWALQRPQGDERDKLLTRIAYAESQVSPADAARVVSASISPGPIQDEAVMSVVHQWGLRDAAGALDWVTGFPQTPLRDRAMGELAGMR